MQSTGYFRAWKHNEVNIHREKLKTMRSSWAYSKSVLNTLKSISNNEHPDELVDDPLYEW